jgi:hypothetical protein
LTQRGFARHGERNGPAGPFSNEPPPHTDLRSARFGSQSS